jgi:hypothetical protein
MDRYDIQSALEELNEDAVLPHPVRLRDMILRVDLGAGEALDLNREFQNYLAPLAKPAARPRDPAETRRRPIKRPEGARESSPAGPREKRRTGAGYVATRRKRAAKMRRMTLLVSADDTLWENNVFFERTIEQFLTLVEPFGYARGYARHVLNETERLNIRQHGYGVRSFARSLEETYVKLAGKLAQRSGVQAVSALVADLEARRRMYWKACRKRCNISPSAIA